MPNALTVSFHVGNVNILPSEHNTFSFKAILITGPTERLQFDLLQSGSSVFV